MEKIVGGGGGSNEWKSYVIRWYNFCSMMLYYRFDFDESGVLFPPYHSNGDQSFIKNRRLQNSKVSQLPEQKPTDATTSCTNEQTITVRKEQINISEQPCQSFISVVNNKGILVLYITQLHTMRCVCA